VAVRAIRLLGDPVLRTPADPVRVFDERTAALAADLLDTVALPGRAGVAAPQVGVGVRAFSYDVEGQTSCVFNPVVSGLSGEQDDDEGCLSVPGHWFPTRRALTATVTGQDAAGRPVTVTGTGLLARCLQHEVDHLDGHLFLDRLDRDVRRAAMRAIRQTPTVRPRPGPRPPSGRSAVVAGTPFSR